MTAGVILSLLLILYFIGCLFTGVKNIGTATGLILSVLLLIAVIFSRELSLLWHKGRLLPLSAFVGIVAVLAISLTGFMIHSSARQPTEGATVVVLGCRVRGETPSLMLSRRIRAAGEYLLEHESSVCVLSGGKGKGEEISEAEAMRRELIKMGIAESRIFLEDKSTDTEENLRFSAAVIAENGLNTDIAIATDGFHQCRAWLNAKQCGLNAGAVGAKTPFWLLPPYYIRELYGVLAELALMLTGQR